MHLIIWLIFILTKTFNFHSCLEWLCWAPSAIKINMLNMFNITSRKFHFNEDMMERLQ